MRILRADFSITLRATCAALFSLATIVAPSIAQTIGTPVPHPAVSGRFQPPAWLAFSRAWTSIVAYSATVTVFERKGTQVQNMVLDYDFRKPSNATVHVIQGPNTGATMVWNGGTTLAAHFGSGFMALFKRTLSIHDPLATTIRGSSIDQLSFGAILAQAKLTPGMVSQRRGEVINGVVTDAVKLIPPASLRNTGLTLQVVEISRTTHFPMRVLGYSGRTLVRTIEFSNVRLERQKQARHMTTS